jgi:transcription elongation factor
LARLSTAPVPVTTAQPMRQATLSGTSRSMTMAWASDTTTCSVNTPELANE